jgi:acetyl-CoA C-acetyltransferase
VAQQHFVVFAEPVRTPIGIFGGSLKDVAAPSLGAVAIGAAVACAKLRPDEVEAVVMGNAVQAGTKINPARQAAVHAGLPVTIPAHTVNRVCGSGAQAIVSAAQRLRSATSMLRWRAAWRTWIKRLISSHALVGVTAWAMARSTCWERW